jgi:single-strand selective monofunctional uracil DNA glycosylase
MSRTADALMQASDELVAALSSLRFSEPVTHVYNPLVYARPMFEQYTRRFATGKIKVLFFGMNPGPWGMAQTGTPFGEVNIVRDWLKLDAPVGKPEREHPKRPIEGLACQRSEVSGRRIWGLFAERFATPDAFFRGQERGHYVANYCPLVFMGKSGANITPDKLRMAEREPLIDACNAHLRKIVETLEPRYVVGVGQWAQQRASEVVGDTVTVVRILHPSPASPAANRDWAGQATKQLIAAGVWEG